MNSIPIHTNTYRFVEIYKTEVETHITETLNSPNNSPFRIVSKNLDEKKYIGE